MLISQIPLSLPNRKTIQLTFFDYESEIIQMTWYLVAANVLQNPIISFYDSIFSSAVY